MKTMFKVLSFAAILAVAASPAAYATDVTNSNLTQGPGVYYGNSNQLTNHSWDVVTEGGLQLGLQALTPYVGPISASGNNYTYSPTPNDGTRASWDFAYSVNNAAGSVDAYSYLITVLDNKTGLFATFDPSQVNDNGQANGSAVPCSGSSGCNAPSTTNTGFQNAENLSFGFLATDLHFDVNAADKYTVTLDARDKSGNLIASDSINVVPTPEPSSLILMGTGLVSAAGTILRRRRLA